MGYLAGLVHDMGKCKAEFQSYLRQNAAGEELCRKKVIHTFAGVRYLLEKGISSDDWIHSLAAEMAAYAVGAHHGLFDLCGENRRANGFDHRISNDKICYEESVHNFLTECCTETALKNQLSLAAEELSAVLERIVQISGDEAERHFYLGLLVRLILSAVIDGDRTDTAAFMQGKPPFEPPVPNWKSVLKAVEKRLNLLPAQTEIDLARRKISEQCSACGVQAGGILCLNVPTGGGKTLSSLRYALTHAAHTGKSRIIFTSPLLSILEQNAAEIRRYVGDDSLILEHHSNVMNLPNNQEEAAILDMWTENWSAPIILTTLVQLLNTCFDGRTGSIRRFSSLANSIIVIDEVQTVPGKMLSMFNSAINFLAEICHCTVILCSATQPCLETTAHPLWKIPRDIVPFDAALWKIFERTELIPVPGRKEEQVPDFCREVLAEVNSLLVVCNKKGEAEKLCRELSGTDAGVFHLSAAMCVQHRRDTINALKRSLADKSRKTICVSTQVIEAGVNISFEAVIRLTAGMDSVIQSAGRCNRHGESPVPGKVYILNVRNEDLNRLQDIRRGKGATMELLEIYERNPARFGYTLSSKAAIDRYYENYYRDMNRGSQDFPVEELGGKTLFDLLGENDSYLQEDYPYTLGQAFDLAGKHFHVFDDDTVEVIVPYTGKAEGTPLNGKEIISHLLDFPNSWEIAEQMSYLKQAKPYTISVRRYEQEKLEKEGLLNWKLNGTVAVLSEECYDNATGFSAKPSASEFLAI